MTTETVDSETLAQHEEAKISEPKEYSSAHPLTHVDALRHPLKLGDELVCLCCGARGVHNEEHIKSVEKYEENSRWFSHEAGSSWVKESKWLARLREEAARALASEALLHGDIGVAAASAEGDVGAVARLIRILSKWEPEARAHLVREMRIRYPETRTVSGTETGSEPRR